MMKEIISVIRTFFAYLIRPQLYPELLRKIYKNIFDRKSPFKGKQQAEERSCLQSGRHQVHDL